LRVTILLSWRNPLSMSELGLLASTDDQSGGIAGHNPAYYSIYKQIMIHCLSRYVAFVRERATEGIDVHRCGSLLNSLW